MLVPVTLTMGLNALFQIKSYLVLELSLLSSVKTVVIKCALFFFRKQVFVFRMTLEKICHVLTNNHPRIHSVQA